MSSDCCSCGSNNCCAPQPERKLLVIDFLYLDLSVCERCQGTDSNLDQAIHEVSNVLSLAGYEVQLNKVNINTEELAIQYHFLSSPTIRINGTDIDLSIRETACKECGDLCGDTVDCRVWEYEGVDYNEPPVAMLINAILKEIYHPAGEIPPSYDTYSLPENLRKFFTGKNK